MSLPTGIRREVDIQGAIIDLAHLFGWRVAHFRPARTAKGWRTAVAADGAGFPDLVLLRDERMLVREIKAGKNKTSNEQNDWIDAFRVAGIDVGIWTEADVPEGIIEELKRR